jgi:hypothetical protein
VSDMVTAVVLILKERGGSFFTSYQKGIWQQITKLTVKNWLHLIKNWLHLIKNWLHLIKNF